VKRINIMKEKQDTRKSMTQKTGQENRNSGSVPCGCGPGSGCSIEGVLSVDERGQMVLPKDVRERAGIRTGDKLALISWEKNGSICCLALIKADSLSGMVKDVIGPLITPGD
jgi:antitoxin PrlF